MTVDQFRWAFVFLVAGLILGQLIVITIRLASIQIDLHQIVLTVKP